MDLSTHISTLLSIKVMQFYTMNLCFLEFLEHPNQMTLEYPSLALSWMFFLKKYKIATVERGILGQVSKSREGSVESFSSMPFSYLNHPLNLQLAPSVFVQAVGQTQISRMQQWLIQQFAGRLPSSSTEDHRRGRGIRHFYLKASRYITLLFWYLRTMKKHSC